MADGTRMNQIAESIVILKKNVEKNEKLLEKVEKRLELNDTQVKNQLSDFMQNSDRKFETKWEEFTTKKKVVSGDPKWPLIT